MNKIVTFKILSQIYGLSIDEVESIIKCNKITKLPDINKTTPSLLGLINLRNIIIPILDLTHIISNTYSSNGLDILICHDKKNYPIGFLVDKVDQVIPIDLKNIEKPSTMVNNVYLKGIYLLDENPIIILDIGELTCLH